MFDFSYILYQLIFAALSAVFAGFLGNIRSSSDSCDDSRSRSNNREENKSFRLPFSIPAAIVAFVTGALLQYFLFYVDLPSLYGSFGGYFGPLVLAWLIGAVTGVIFAEQRLPATGMALLPLVLLIGWPIALFFFYNVGPNNAQNFANLPNITVASESDQIPPTDTNHLIMVSSNMAAFEASTALTSDAADANLSTQFQVGNLTLQSIRGHRYYAAPLVPVNTGAVFWTPLFGGRSDSPGYILVDAENTQAKPQIHLGFTISLFDTGAFAMNLNRFVYEHGYQNGDLDDATFEVDDNWQPHWTIAYLQPAFGNFSGSKLAKVIVVDVAQHDPVIHAYDPTDSQVSWVDRVVSQSLVLQYASDWGAYSSPSNHSDFLSWLGVAWGFTKTNVVEPSTGDEAAMLTYTTDQQNSWIIPMTSANSTDSSVLGVLVFDTKQNKGVYYPGLHGFNHGDSAAATMSNAQGNRINKYNVDNIELYSIFGVPTWVSIYTSDQPDPNTGGTDSTFGAIGLMSANNQNSASVAYAGNLQDALNQYSEILATGSAGMTVTQSSHQVSFKGTIWRIGSVGDDTWLFQLYGDKHYYTVAPKNYTGTPLLRDDDHVEGTYLDTDQPEVSVSTLSLLDAGPNATPPGAATTK